MTDYKLDQEVWVRCTIRYEQTQLRNGDERYFVGKDEWENSEGANNRPVMPDDIRTLEELTSEAVKAERERIVEWLNDDNPSSCYFQGVIYFTKDRLVEFLSPPKPTLRSVLKEVFTGWEYTDPDTAIDEIEAALEAKGVEVPM